MTTIEEDEHNLRERALELLKKSGVPLNLRRNKVWFDGKAIAAGRKVKPEDILHEGAHWLMAHPSRRGWVNYGLGTDPDMDTPEKYRGLECRDPRVLDCQVDEEVMASGAGILMVAMIGGDYDSNLRNHSWDIQEDGAKDLIVARKRLRDAGVEIPEVAYRNVQAALKRLLKE
jgi:hypothetical protein